MASLRGARGCAGAKPIPLFNKALEDLWPEIHKHKKDMGIFLAQAINVNAGEDCLKKITDDMRRWTEASKRGEIK